MTQATITGIGWVTTAGPGRGGGGTGFDFTPGHLPPLTRRMVFPGPNQRFGRQSDYSKVGLAAIAFALRDAGIEEWQVKRPVGIVASTRLGCLATDLDYFAPLLDDGGGLASPNLFAYTLATCFLGEAAIQFGLTGSTLAVNDAAGDDTVPLSMAMESLAWGECDTMLAGICDLPPPPGLAPEVPVLPGALFMVLEKGINPRVPGYGTLSLHRDGTIRHGNDTVESFTGLAATSLADPPSGDRERPPCA